MSLAAVLRVEGTPEATTTMENDDPFCVSLGVVVRCVPVRGIKNFHCLGGWPTENLSKDFFQE